MFIVPYASLPSTPPGEGEILSESGKGRFRPTPPPASGGARGTPTRRSARRQAAAADCACRARGRVCPKATGGDAVPRRLRRKAARNHLLPTERPARGRDAHPAVARKRRILSERGESAFRPVAPPAASSADRPRFRPDARRRAAAPISPRGASEGGFCPNATRGGSDCRRRRQGAAPGIGRPGGMPSAGPRRPSGPVAGARHFVRKRRKRFPTGNAVGDRKRRPPSIPAGCPAPGRGARQAPSREGAVLSESGESGFRVMAPLAIGDAGYPLFRQEAQRRAAMPTRSRRAKRAVRPNATKSDPAR